MAKKSSYYTKNLRTWLFVSNIKTEDFAVKLGLTKQSIYRYLSEDRTPDLDKIALTADLMGYSIDEVINRDLSIDIMVSTGFTDVMSMEEWLKFQKGDTLVTTLKSHLAELQVVLLGAVEKNQELLNTV